jgi:hypothetical protein
MIATGNIDTYAWDALTRNLEDVRQLPQRLRGVKEHQVQPLEDAIRKLTYTEYVDRAVREFIAGVLLAEFAQGSFDYLPMVTSIVRQLPLSGFWFAILASEAKSTDVLRFSDSFGRLLKVQLEAEVSSPPRADIAFLEIAALPVAMIGAKRLRRPNGSEIVVELFDSVNTRVRIADKVEVVSGSGEPAGRGRLVDEMENLRRAAKALLAELDNAAPPVRGNTQHQLPLMEEAPHGRKPSPKQKQARRAPK